MKVPFTNCNTVAQNFGKCQLYEGKVGTWRGKSISSSAQQRASARISAQQGVVLEGLLWNHRALGCLEGRMMVVWGLRMVR